ncbi:small cysteine-rich protein 1-like [Oculina patagonica]
MEAKLCLCLLLFILGTITVQGARLGEKENSMKVRSKACSPPIGYCTWVGIRVRTCPIGTYGCSSQGYSCHSLRLTCCCPGLEADEQ